MTAPGWLTILAVLCAGLLVYLFFRSGGPDRDP